MNSQLTQFLSISLVLISVSVTSAAENAFDVRTNTCLFLDDHFIAKQSGITRMWHQGKPRPEIAVEEKEPWENWPTLWGSCFYDPKYKVYRKRLSRKEMPGSPEGCKVV